MSSGEAEYYGMVRGASLALGVRSLMNDLGEEPGVMLMTDASAAVGIAKRRGLGKVSHIALSQLWIQEKGEANGIDIMKVRGEENRADALTKHVGREKTQEHMRWTGQEVAPGRHQLAPEVR